MALCLRVVWVGAGVLGVGLMLVRHFPAPLWWEDWGEGGWGELWGVERFCLFLLLFLLLQLVACIKETGI